jgi:hypothetical protein
MGYFSGRYFPKRYFAGRYFSSPRALIAVIGKLLGLARDQRFIALGADVRAIAFAADERSISFGGEYRAIELDAETRTITLAADEGMSDTGKWDAKDPEEVLFYSLDWTGPLDGDEISTATWTAAAGITVANQTVTGAVTKAKLSGGADGTGYAIKVTVVTTGGQTIERTRTLKVKTK